MVFSNIKSCRDGTRKDTLYLSWIRSIIKWCMAWSREMECSSGRCSRYRWRTRHWQPYGWIESSRRLSQMVERNNKRSGDTKWMTSSMPVTCNCNYLIWKTQKISNMASMGVLDAFQKCGCNSRMILVCCSGEVYSMAWILHLGQRADTPIFVSCHFWSECYWPSSSFATTWAEVTGYFPIIHNMDLSNWDAMGIFPSFFHHTI